MKTLACTASILFVLCGPALAQPTPPAAPSPTAPTAQAPLRFQLSVQYGADRKSYALVLQPDGCGEVKTRHAAGFDQIEVCTRPTSGALLVDVHWELQRGAFSYATKWKAVVARGGAVTVGTSGLDLTLAMK